MSSPLLPLNRPSAHTVLFLQLPRAPEPALLLLCASQRAQPWQLHPSLPTRLCPALCLSWAPFLHLGPKPLHSAVSPSLGAVGLPYLLHSCVSDFSQEETECGVVSVCYLPEKCFQKHLRRLHVLSLWNCSHSIQRQFLLLWSSILLCFEGSRAGGGLGIVLLPQQPCPCVCCSKCLFQRQAVLPEKLLHNKLSSTFQSFSCSISWSFLLHQLSVTRTRSFLSCCFLL